MKWILYAHYWGMYLYIKNPCPYQKFVPSMGKGTGNINTQRTVGLLKEAVNQWKGFIQYLFFTKVGNMLTLAIYLCLQRRRLLFYYNHFKLRLSYLFYILQMYLIRRLKSLYVSWIKSIAKGIHFQKKWYLIKNTSIVGIYSNNYIFIFVLLIMFFNKVKFCKLQKEIKLWRDSDAWHRNNDVF